MESNPSTLFRESSVSECRKSVFAFITLFFMVALVYSNTLNCSWHFDDFINIVENPRLHMREVSWDTLKQALCSDRNYPTFPYRPVAGITFAINYYLGGTKVKGYHLVNIAIHFISAFFLYLFLYRTLLLKTLKQCRGKAFFISMLATTLWAINPIQTQAVTYIVQRMASMAAMFYIMGMYFYLQARTADRRNKRIGYFLLCFFSFLLSLGSKENAAIFPVSVFLYEMLILQEDPIYFLKKAWPWLSICAAITLIIGLSYMYFKTGHLFISQSDFRNRLFTPTQRLLTETRVVLYYISLIFYPMPNRLCIVRDFSISTPLFNPPSTFLAILVIVLLIVLAVFLARKNPLISFCIGFFFINHMIESTIFPLELYFEHRNYLPSMLAFVPVAIAIARGLEIYRNKTIMVWVLSGFMILVMVGYGHSTYMRNFSWRTEESLWLDALSKSPYLPRVHHNLGRYYADRGIIDKGIEHYEKAIKLKRGTARETDHLTYYNLALIYLKDKEYAKATELLEKALKISPRFSDAYNSLATIKLEQGDYDSAYELALQSLRYNSVNVRAYNNLGLILMQKEQYHKAFRIFSKARDLDRDDLITIVNLGIASKHLGKYRKALGYFREALRRNPKEFFTRLQLAETFLYIGKPKLAKHCLEKLLVLFSPQQIEEKLQNVYSEYVSSIQPDKKLIGNLLKQLFSEKSQEYSKMAERLFRELNY